MQSCQMIESQSKLICSNNHKDQPVIFVILDEGIASSERLKCSLCLVQIRGKINGMSYLEAIQKIQEIKNQLLQEKTTYINSKLDSLKKFQDHIENTKSLVMQKLEQIINHLELRRRTLLQLIEKSSHYNILEEIDNINKSNQQLIDFESKEFREQVGELIHTFQKKTYYNLEILRNQINNEQTNILMENIINQNKEVYLDYFQQSFQSLINTNQQFQISTQQQNINKNTLESTGISKIYISSLEEKINSKEQIEKFDKTTYKLISSIQQKEICTGLAINKDGSLIAASCNNDIKIWKIINGNLIDQKILLKGHENIVFCIVFSKKIDWFVSCGMDNSLRCWIDRNKKSWFSSHSWKGSKAYTHHANSSYVCF